MDAVRGGLCIANAGLPYPFVLRQGERLDELPLSGLPLGMFPDSEMRPYDMREIELAAGETLLLASDGLGEVRDAEGEFFQDGRLREALEQLRGRSAQGLATACSKTPHASARATVGPTTSA